MLRPAACLVVVSFFAASAIAQPGPGFDRVFGNPILEVEGRSFSLTPADLDGDGLPDVVTAGEGQVIVYRNRGNGSVIEHYRAPLSAPHRYPRQAASGDLDRDGDQDLVVVHDDWLFVLRNPGNGRLVENVRYRLETRPKLIELAEVTGDGNLDFVAIGWEPESPNRLELRAGLGQATFQPPRLIDLVESVRDMTLADFDGDSVLDLAFTTSTSVEAWLNDGQGRFVRAFSHPGLDATSVAAADLDGDGDPDLLFQDWLRAPESDGRNGRIEVLANDGQADFSPFESILFRYRGDGMFTGDVNGDGHPDVVVGGDELESQNHVFLNDGAGSLRLRSSHQSDGLRASSIADMNGDGLLDLVFTGELVGPAVFFNLGDARFPAPCRVGSWAARLGSVALADFSGDGRADLAHVGSTCQSRLLIAEDILDPRRRREQEVPALTQTRSPRVARLDGDSYPDVLAIAPEAVVTFRGTSTGLQPFQRVLLPGLHPLEAVTGDFDSEGHDDALVLVNAPFARHLLAFLRNAGDGQLFLDRIFSVGGIPASLEGIDFDRDGFEDLVFRLSDPRRFEIWLSRPGGFLPIRQEVPFEGSVAWHAFADFDRDGDLDLALQKGAIIEILANLGNEGFQPALELEAKGPGPLRTGDFDGDGWIDLVSVSIDPEVLTVYRRDASGRLRPPEHYATQLRPFVVRDLDGDGRDDLAGIAVNRLGKGSACRVLSLR